MWAAINIIGIEVITELLLKFIQISTLFLLIAGYP